MRNLYRILIGKPSVRNGNLEVPVYFLKAKKDISSENEEKVNGYSMCRYKIQEQKKFRYDIPAILSTEEPKCKRPLERPRHI
jgi:hypothetical protein